MVLDQKLKTVYWVSSLNDKPFIIGLEMLMKIGQEVDQKKYKKVEMSG